MSIDVIKFDWELCDKIDEIFNKHKVNYSYRKYIEKINKQYNGDMYRFADDYGSYEWVKYPKFKLIQYGKNLVNTASDFEILQLSAGFIRKICLPPHLNEIEDFTDVNWSWVPIENVEDLDAKLTELENRYDELIKFYKKPEMKILLKSLDTVIEQEKALAKEKEELCNKLKTQVKKVINITNDF